MKINVTLILCLFTMLFFQSIESKAQEAGSPSFEKWDKDSRNEREKVIAHPDVTHAPVVFADSATIRQRNGYKPSPVVPKAPKSGDGETDDSILSFNFLYYLIQKYKMQDIIE